MTNSQSNFLVRYPLLRRAIGLLVGLALLRMTLRILEHVPDPWQLPFLGLGLLLTNALLYGLVTRGSRGDIGAGRPAATLLVVLAVLLHAVSLGLLVFVGLFDGFRPASH